jgi:hypothetical protein
MGSEASVADVLARAHELLEGGTAWTQGRYASDRNGDRVSAVSLDAVEWCAIGACYRASYELGVEGSLYAKACDSLGFAALPHIKQRDLSEWNDTAQWLTVERAFERAIANEMMVMSA